MPRGCGFWFVSRRKWREKGRQRRGSEIGGRERGEKSGWNKNKKVEDRKEEKVEGEHIERRRRVIRRYEEEERG